MGCSASPPLGKGNLAKKGEKNSKLKPVGQQVSDLQQSQCHSYGCHDDVESLECKKMMEELGKMPEPIGKILQLMIKEEDESSWGSWGSWNDDEDFPPLEWKDDYDEGMKEFLQNSLMDNDATDGEIEEFLSSKAMDSVREVYKQAPAIVQNWFWGRRRFLIRRPFGRFRRRFWRRLFPRRRLVVVRG